MWSPDALHANERLHVNGAVQYDAFGTREDVMAAKSPQKHNEKKAGKSLKDKRIAKKAKKSDKGSIV